MAAGEIPVNKVYEDDTVLAFHDIDPQAPVHVLVIPKAHIASPAHITPENSAVVAHVFEVIASLAGTLGLENGYRVVTNCGADGGQQRKEASYHAQNLYPSCCGPGAGAAAVPGE